MHFIFCKMIGQIYKFDTHFFFIPTIINCYKKLWTTLEIFGRKAISFKAITMQKEHEH